MSKIKLNGFNNISKTLLLSFYYVYWNEDHDEAALSRYVNKLFSADALAATLDSVCKKIGATVLNVGLQDYSPHGASAAFLVAEEPMPAPSIVAHLDKSHLTIHTYPDVNPASQVCTFRVDIEISTCGEINPLILLDELITLFSPDVVSADFRERGFTRDSHGVKIGSNEEILSFDRYLSDANTAIYSVDNHVFPPSRIMFSKFLKTVEDININNCFIGSAPVDKRIAKDAVCSEILEVFNIA